MGFEKELSKYRNVIKIGQNFKTSGTIVLSFQSTNFNDFKNDTPTNCIKK